MSAIQAAAPYIQASFELKPVSGEAVGGRWKIVNGFFKKQIQSLYETSHYDLLREIEWGSDLKCRLLYDHQIPVGVIVYTTIPGVFWGYEQCLRVDVLYATDQEIENENQKYTTYLLDHAISNFKKSKAKFLTIKVARKAFGICQILENRDFQLVYQYPVTGVYSLSKKEIQDIKNRSDEENLKKRKAEELDYQDFREELKRACV